MLHFIIFLIAAAFYSWIFKLVGGLIELIFMVPFFGRGTEGIARSMELRPRIFFTALITKNIILGLGNATLIFWFTARYLEGNGGNFWLYVSISIIWSLFILSSYNAFPVMFFFTSTVTVVLYWFSFGAMAWMLTGILTFIASIAYYFGRINIIREHNLYGKFE